MVNSGDTAFMMLCTAMVCLMTPGLAFFYGGLTRKRSVLFIAMQSFISMGIITLIWTYGGFGLAFGKDKLGVIGNFSDYFALHGVGLMPSLDHAQTIPFALFFLFQLMFCVITVPLMSGAFAEKVNMKGYILLLIIWTLLVYIPVCHWVWGDGFLQKLGFVDFAGGSVIHTTAGFAALASVLALGGNAKKNIIEPNNLMVASIGTGLLWFGWFGFNAGGALAANMLATKAFTNTLLGLSSGMVSWLVFAKIVRGKINFNDVLTGSVAGLATVTPAVGYVSPNGAIVIGIVAGIVCNLAIMFRKKANLDDTLDVWGVHGVGGFTGIVLIGFLSKKSVNHVSASSHQILVQIGGILIISVYTVIVTYIILKIMDKIMNIRPTQKQVEEGLDKTLLEEMIE